VKLTYAESNDLRLSYAVSKAIEAAGDAGGPAWLVYPFPVYARLRQEAPVH